MDVKRALIEQALRERCLDYEVGFLEGRNGYVVTDPSINEAILKKAVMIRKDSLRRWFESMPINDRPAFLFDESRAITPDGSEVAEMNTLKALAVMAWLLAENSSQYKKGNKPNCSAIKNALLNRATDAGMDTKGIASLEKKIATALNLFDIDKHNFR
jgi:hypothetical protein